MQIQINYGDIDGSDALADAIEKAVQKELSNVADRITRVEVHLRDDKQKRRGPNDKRCLMEARIASERPLAVEARTNDIYHAVTEAAGKLGRAVTTKLDRMKS